MRNVSFRCAIALAVLAVAPVYGCGESDAGKGTVASTSGSGGGGASSVGTGGAGGGAGGTGGAGGESAEEQPNYDLAFPQERVVRLDITIAPQDWQAIVDDMTDMLGEFAENPGGGMPPGGGAGGGMMGGGPPQELFDACDGLAVGDACTATLAGTELSGTCSDFRGTGLFCRPAGGPGGPGGPGGGSSDLIPRTPVYVDCDVATEDRVWHHVGIRLKGNSSLAMPWSQGIGKLPLRLTFDQYADTYPETKHQRFYGFEALGLSNGSSDPSLVREKVATELFVKAGIPAPATAFYRVFVDHGDGSTYFGLYTGTELPTNDAFLDSHFGGHKGNLYKPDGTGARWETWDVATLGKENHKAEADFSDAQALFDALHAPHADPAEAAAWRAGLEARFDVDEFLHWLALNTVTQDWDTYGQMSHNYYLYADPKNGGIFTWIPWDHSYAFFADRGLSLGMTEVTEQWPLIRYLIDDPEYLEVYRGYVAQAAQTEYEPISAGARFQAAHDLIAPYVVGPEGEIEGYTFVDSSASFDSALAELIAHVAMRQQDVATYLQP